MSDPLAALAGMTGDGWLVGGALRDRLMGRASTDYDVALSVEPAPVVLPDAGTFAEFVTTVVLRPHLARLPDELRGRFVERLARDAACDDPPFSLDYCRLNLLGQRPAS